MDIADNIKFKNTDTFLLILTIELWPKETDGACYAKIETFTHVLNQAECQNFCTAKAECVGISMERNLRCRTCEDDDYDDSFYDLRGYSFYRRPG